MNEKFALEAPYKPAGDQPVAIEAITKGLNRKDKNQVLLGVTGSGKTFTMANVIQKIQKPAMILAPNKTLAAQLFSEMRQFFPHNAVEYFVSYYDYYQPEAYIARTDTYIEKDAMINEQIDRMRHSATRALLERDDVIIVASVSCIYGIGSPETYQEMTVSLSKGEKISVKELLKKFVELQYKRNDITLNRGEFRVKGDVIEIFPAHLESTAWRISLFDEEIEKIQEIDPLLGERGEELDSIKVYGNSHYITPRPTLRQAIVEIKKELKIRCEELLKENKLIEEQRLRERTTYDIEMLESTGMCSGIENYSRYLTGRKTGEPPPTLFEYLPKDAILFVDESHVMVPQIHGMARGDFSRKSNLTNYGFRLQSCVDNRPLKFEEWDERRPSTIFVSATPGNWEIEQTHGAVIEQIVRPTGLVDPKVEIHKTENQVDDLIDEIQKTVKKRQRVLVTTLTKKMSEALTNYLAEANIKVKYLHSDIETLERIEIIRELRAGEYDVLVGINLLREGLDIPECGMVAILDADKEGYLRSKTALIQTIGRAARNIDGRVILYADNMTRSMKEAIDETNRRIEKQEEYNKAHNITPRSIEKSIADIIIEKEEEIIHEEESIKGEALHNYIDELSRNMKKLAENLRFEEAAEIRDEIRRLEMQELGM